MELESNYIVSKEKWDPRREEIQQTFLSSVENFLRRDLLTKDRIHDRFLSELENDLSATWRSDRILTASLARSWEFLSDPDCKFLSQQRLASLLSKHPAFPTTDNEPLAALFYDLLAWHASFPFEPGPTAPPVDRKGWTRAVLLLTQRRDAHAFFTSTYSALGDTWGAHDGWYLTRRGRSSLDVRRSLFRSLAQGAPSARAAASSEEPLPADTVQVPRYLKYVPRGRDNRAGAGDGDGDAEHASEADDEEQQVVFTVEEDERNVDLLDVLAWTPPEAMGGTANPMRESYSVVLGELSGYAQPLRSLRVPRSRVLLLWDMARSFAESEGDGKNDDGAVELDLSEDGEEMEWERFNSVMEQGENMRLLDQLRKLVGSLMDVPVPED